MPGVCITINTGRFSGLKHLLSAVEKDKTQQPNDPKDKYPCQSICVKVTNYQSLVIGVPLPLIMRQSSKRAADINP